MDAPRRICVWCPDWPVAALGVDPTEPAAVVTANRVVACSHAAREHGVRRGQRRREAQAACPTLAVRPRNEEAEARAFEPVVAALESIAPGVEITRPGLAAIGVRGPSRYFGGETGVLHAQAGEWSGIGLGRGRLRARRVDVTAAGKGTAARRRAAQLWLPADGGGVDQAPAPVIDLAG